MKRTWWAALGAAAVLVVPASAGAADNSVIVKYKAGSAAKTRDAAANRAGVGSVLGSVAANGAQVVQVAGDPAAAAATLARSAAVEYAEPNVELHALATPNDARFGELYGLNNANDADMDAPEGWDAAGLGGFPATGGVKVGIVDTGIDTNHEDLSGKTVECAQVQLLTNRVTEGNCTDQNDHGTHVAGTIAAKANNGVGVAGVSFSSQLAICKALNAARLRHDRGRGELHHLPRRQGREDHLDVARRRRVDHAADRGHQRLQERHGHADHRRGRQRRRRDAQLPGRLPRGRLGGGDRQHGQARLVLQRQRGRRDRRRGRERALDQARRRVRGVLRHLDGDAARLRRGRA